MDGFFRCISTITKTMKESLYGSAAIPNQKIVAPANDGVETTVTTSGDSYTITLKILTHQ